MNSPKFYLPITLASEKAIEATAGLKFANVYFAKCTLACDSPKFLPPKFPSIQYILKMILALFLLLFILFLKLELLQSIH